MRYAVAEKLEIIRLVEQSSLPVRRTLDQLCIPRSTFYCWYDRYRTGQAEDLKDRSPAPRRVWNKLPVAVSQSVLELALKEPQLSPRELAVSFVDRQQYFVSEASVYRLLKAHDLITSPAFILLKAADHFVQPTTAPNQLWQTDFTYLRVIGWGWFYLSTVLDDFSRYILAWKLLENYYLPGQLEARLAEFVDYYNSRRYHESLNNLTPADMYFGRGQTILTRRENIKLKTIELRRRLHHQTAASTSTQMDQILS